MTKTLMNTISMQAGSRIAEIQIYDAIGESFFVDGVTAKAFTEALSDLGEVDEIHVRFNTPGGHVFHGVAIYNALNRHPAKKIGHVDALAASMGSIILMSCDEINIAENAIVMIHNVRGGCEGEAKDMRAYADKLDKLNANAVNIYAGRSGQKPEAVIESMNVETWYSAEEAVAAGFAHKITPNKQIVASCDVTRFSNVPDWASTRMQAKTQPPKKVDAMPTEKTPEEIAASLKADIEAKAAAEVEAKAKHDAEVAKARKEATEGERNRITAITALCSRAGSPELAAGFCEDAECQPESVQEKLFAVLCDKNKPVGDGGGSDLPKTPDANAAFRAEFKAEPAYATDMTEDQYVAMRRIDEGLDTLEIGK